MDDRSFMDEALVLAREAYAAAVALGLLLIKGFLILKCRK